MVRSPESFHHWVHAEPTNFESNKPIQVSSAYQPASFGVPDTRHLPPPSSASDLDLSSTFQNSEPCSEVYPTLKSHVPTLSNHNLSIPPLPPTPRIATKHPTLIHRPPQIASPALASLRPQPTRTIVNSLSPLLLSAPHDFQRDER